MSGLLRFHGSEALLSQSQNIHGGIGIAIHGKTAHRTQMPPIRQLLLGAALLPVRAVAASRTVLRSVSRVDGKYLTTGAFSLRRENGTKLRPGGVRDGFRQAVIAKHILDAQFFNSNNAETVDDPPRVLMAKVMPSIADTLMNTRNDFTGFLPSVGAALLFRQLSLCFGKRLLFLAEEAWVYDALSIGEGRESLETNIDTDGFLGVREKLRFDLLAETSEPFVIDPPHGTGFEFPPGLSVEFGLDLPNFGQADRAVSDLETIVLSKSDAVVLAFAFEPGKAWCFAFLYSLEERLKREFHTMRHILEHLAINRFEFGVIFLPFRQVRLLGEVSH